MAIEQIEKLPDVSFIDDDINLDGIQKQMLQDYQDKYMEETGEETVLDRGEPIALILYACSVQIYQMYMYVDRAGKQNLLKYAFGAFLDNLAALKGIERTAAKPATVTMRFTLSEAQTGAIAIPAGTRVTDGEAYFTTDKYAEIKAGETTVDVACTSIETGVDLNGIHEGAIQTLVDPIPYIESVTNITETDGGADPESDESLKDRIYIAPSRYSTAGTEEAYIYWVKTYNSTIADVKVSSDNPGEVDIVFLMNDGIPSQEMITGLTKYITDPNIRPLTDKVVVKAPTAVNYSISLTYYINSSDSGSVETIQSEVAKAVDDFVTWQQSKIGRDINSSELIKRVTAAGAKRVEIKSPVFQKIGGTSIAYCTSKNVTYGGDARLIEWFDFTEPPIEANTFDVETEALMTKDIINELTSVIKKVKNSKSHIRRVTVLRELHSAATMATCITAINECTVSNHEISDTDATEGMNVAAVAAPVTETYALNTTAGDVQATAGAFIASATGTEGSTYVLNDNQGATEASGTIDVGPVNASEESTHALNAETGKADLSQSERAAMRANIDYQTTTVIKEE